VALIVSYEKNGAVPWQTRERVAGFQEVIAEAGYAVPEWRQDLQNQFTREPDFQSVILLDSRKRSFPGSFEQVLSAADEILRHEVRPDAIICCNDAYAMGVINVCKRQGLAVPEEITVTGFDNVSYGILGGVVPTTVEQPTEAMCEKAVSLLRARMSSRAQTEEIPEKHAMPCRVIWRESTHGSQAPASSLVPSISE
jgi:DNA-binding LacI/PurR family transcriptional regulator